MNAVVKVDGKPSLIATMAATYGIDPDQMYKTLRATAFKGDVTTEQMVALCVVANQYGLNPWTKEIYAFPDKRNGIVPVVGVDGWSRLMNSNPAFNGMDFKEADDGSWIECTIYRKDREHPITAREWMAECKRDTGPWQSHPRRMLRHKAMIQCARMAFGLVGIYDPDEAERIIDVTPSAPDLSTDERDQVEKMVAEVRDVFELDVDEPTHADMLFAIHQRVCTDDILYSAFQKAVIAAKAGGIKSAHAWRKWIEMGSKQFQARNAEAAIERM
jgi:phage recombination protein Bet